MNVFKRSASQQLHAEPPAKKQMSEPETSATTPVSDWPEMDNITDSEWRELDPPRGEQYRPSPALDHKCSLEKGRLLCERTFPLTKSGSKYVATGVDPTAYNEPLICIRQRVFSGYISFDTAEFEEFLSLLPQVLDAIIDVPAEDNEDMYKVIAELKSYHVLLLPHYVVKFQHASMSSNICLAADTLRVFTHIGVHLLTHLAELKEERRALPRMDLFTMDLAQRVVRDSEGTLNDNTAHQVIRDTYHDNYNAYELYYRYHHHVHREVARLVFHMQMYNNYDFFNVHW